MPPRKKPAAPPSTKARKAPAKRRAKTRALALAGAAIRQEPLRSDLLASPLAMIEPLRRSIIERQIALLDAAIAWSPARWMIHQQAAFWDGLVASDRTPTLPAKRKPLRKRVRAK